MYMFEGIPQSTGTFSRSSRSTGRFCYRDLVAELMEAKQRTKIYCENTCMLPGSRRLQVCNYSLCARVVLCPDADELVEVMRAEDGGVPGEVVEVVHDDGDEEVEHDEGAEENEGDEVEV